MRPPARTWLYVPGHDERRIGKALASGADAVIIDLEDAVPADEKVRARETALRVATERAGAVEAPESPQLWVRINDVESVWHRDELVAFAGAPVHGLRIPKVETVDAVRSVADETGLAVQLILESARGLLDAPALAAAHPAVAGIGLGEADLSADLRVAPSGLAWARGWVVAAARAAGLPSPTQSVWTHVADLDGLRESSILARENGFHGRAVIHPAQIPIVNEVFTPTVAEIDAAQEIVDAALRAAEQGSAALLDARGRFIDPAVVEQARVVLSLARVSEAPRS